MVEGEDGDACGDKRDDKIFIEGIVFAKNGQVQEHDWKELAGLGQNEGNIVDMREGGIAEGGGK